MSKIKSENSELVYAIMCWSTLIAQFILLIQNRTTSVAEAMMRFFTFFTITTNILVALIFTVIWLKPNDKSSFLARYSTKTAAAVFIFVVGFVYNVILRFLWQPQGVQKIVDEMLHLVIPILYCLYWFFKMKVQLIQWKSILIWLIYPLVYLIVIMIRGAFSHYYPYPFVNVSDLGYYKVMLNCIGMTFFFALISTIAVGVIQHRIKSANRL